MKATIKGKKDVIIKQGDGRTTWYTLEFVKYRKQAKVNLLSLTSALSKGGVLSSDDQNKIVINHDCMKIVFDQRIKTHDGWVCGVDVLPSEVQSIEYATSVVDSVREVGMIQRNEKWKQAEKSTE